MTLEIDFDPSVDEINLVLNNQTVLRAHKDHTGRIVFGKGFAKIEDTGLSDMIKAMCTSCLNLTEV